MKNDDSELSELFYLVDKYEKHPEELTEKEKKRLRELGIEI